MTAAHAVLADIRARGVRAFPRDGRLRLEPLEALTPELIERARAVRDELLAILAAESVTARVVIDAIEPHPGPIALNGCTTIPDPKDCIAADLASLERVVASLAEARRTGDRRASDLEDDVHELLARLEACGARVRVDKVAP